MRIPSLSFLNRKPPENVLAAVGPVTHGVAVARVRRDRELPATLDLCAFQTTESVEQQSDAMAGWSRRYGLNRIRCSTLIETGGYSLLMVEAPDVPEDELAAAVRWRVKDLIDFPVEDAVIDVFDVPPQKDTQQGRMIYVVVARAPLVKTRVDQLLAAGLNLDVVDIPELSQRNVAACLPEDVAGAALLHLANDSGIITLTRQGMLYFARRLEYGLDAIGWLPEGDEGFPHSGLPYQVQGWLDNLVVEIQRSLDYYESHYKQAPIGSLIIAPLERAIPGMSDYFANQLGMTVRVLDLNTVIDCREPIDGSLQAQCFPLIGAALRVD